jgi:hypothetical protein
MKKRINDEVPPQGHTLRDHQNVNQEISNENTKKIHQEQSNRDMERIYGCRFMKPMIGDSKQCPGRTRKIEERTKPGHC